MLNLKLIAQLDRIPGISRKKLIDNKPIREQSVTEKVTPELEVQRIAYLLYSWGKGS